MWPSSILCSSSSLTATVYSGWLWYYYYYYVRYLSMYVVCCSPSHSLCHNVIYLYLCSPTAADSVNKAFLSLVLPLTCTVAAAALHVYLIRCLLPYPSSSPNVPHIFFLSSIFLLSYPAGIICVFQAHLLWPFVCLEGHSSIFTISLLPHR